MTTQRILTRAAALLTEGRSPSEAIDTACGQVATTPLARRMARRLFAGATAAAAVELGMWR